VHISGDCDCVVMINIRSYIKGGGWIQIEKSLKGIIYVKKPICTQKFTLLRLKNNF
jgi:hypothetical protein